MTSSITINDLKKNHILDRESMKSLKGGVAEGYLFRGPSPSINTSVFPTQIFNIQNLDYTVNNTVIEQFTQQTNNLSQINITEVIAIDSYVDASVNQGQIGLNKF